MRLFDFFRKADVRETATTDNYSETSITDTDASAEQIMFVNEALVTLGGVIAQFGFQRKKVHIKKYSSSVVFRNQKRYVKISSSSYPTDYPYTWNILLGEGDNEDFYESDWNSIALWRMAQFIQPKTSVEPYDFPSGAVDFEKKIKYCVEQAEEQLLKFGISFLKGNMRIFREVRKKVNKRREPYRISQVGADGERHVTYEAKSQKLKKKYS